MKGRGWCRQSEGKLAKACRACDSRNTRLLRSVWRLWRSLSTASRSRAAASGLITRLQARVVQCRTLSAWRACRLAKLSRVCKLLSDEVRTVKASLAVAQRERSGLLAAKEQLTKDAQDAIGAPSKVLLLLCIASNMGATPADKGNPKQVHRARKSCKQLSKLVTVRLDSWEAHVACVMQPERTSSIQVLDVFGCVFRCVWMCLDVFSGAGCVWMCFL
jgi:hypothetical protein